MDRMTQSDCMRSCWMSGVIVGLLVLLLASGMGDSDWLGGLFLGAITCWFLSRSLIWLVCEGAQAPVADDPGLKGPPVPAPKVSRVAPADNGGHDEIYDDLKRITGIGPKTEEMLNSFGVRRFSQIAEWDAGSEAEFTARLGRLGARIGSDGWVAQARAFVVERGGNG